MPLNVIEMFKNNPTHDEKVTFLTFYLSVFPSLEGDKVTFIGSTFLKNGEKIILPIFLCIIKKCLIAKLYGHE